MVFSLIGDDEVYIKADNSTIWSSICFPEKPSAVMGGVRLILALSTRFRSINAVVLPVSRHISSGVPSG